MVHLTETSFNGLAVISRPIKISDQYIYGVLYNIQEEQKLIEKGLGDITEYVNYIVGTEQFIKNGGKISEDCKVWYLPDGVHSFTNNQALNRFLTHLMKGMVEVRKYEFDDLIEAKEGETDAENTRLVLNKDLIERYINEHNTKVEK